MAVVYDFSGSVPPDFITSSFTLTPGEYRISESSGMASCDWYVYNANDSSVIAEGTEGDTYYVLITEHTSVYLEVNAYSQGGFFFIEIDNMSEGGGGGSSGEIEDFHVYELDKGWSFDGAYIPHFLEMNWYFGDDPIHYHSIQKIRIHGMTKGNTQLTVATNGMQTDYERDFSEPQIIDLPRKPKMISAELLPETNTVDSANRGLSIQMKFEGRNKDLSKPEPQHVLQVLAVQSSPAGTGFRAN